jgi:hypothetical protein
MAESFDIVSFLVTVCPALGILGWWIRVLISDNKELRAENKELTNEIIDMSRDQIKVNSEMKSILEIIKNR